MVQRLPMIFEQQHPVTAAQLLETGALGGATAEDIIEVLLDAHESVDELDILAAAFKAARARLSGRRGSAAEARSAQLMRLLPRISGSAEDAVTVLLDHGIGNFQGNEFELVTLVVEHIQARHGHESPGESADTAASPSHVEAAVAAASAEPDTGGVQPGVEEHGGDSAATVAVCDMCQFRPRAPKKKWCSKCSQARAELRDETGGQVKVKHLRLAYEKLRKKGMRRPSVKSAAARARKLAGVA